jgi:hypothetical protein
MQFHYSISSDSEKTPLKGQSRWLSIPEACKKMYFTELSAMVECTRLDTAQSFANIAQKITKELAVSLSPQS